MFVGINLGINQLRGSVSFSPASLFALGEPGVWFDPSDVANLSWRVNLLTFSEQFNASVWTGGGRTISPDVANSPVGTLTADRLDEGLSTGYHFVQQTISPGANVTCTASVYLKYVDCQYAHVSVFSSTNNGAFFAAIFDIQNGVVSASGVGATSGSILSATIQSVGDGWYRCSVSGLNATTPPDQFGVSTGNSDVLSNGLYGLTTFTGTSRKFLFWGAQLELGAVATTYQPITNVNAEVIARFPNATLYQDVAGTIPVTGPTGPTGLPVPVALMLDKSKGLVLGPEAVVNGDFSTGTISGWTDVLNGTLSVSSGALNITATTGNTGVYQVRSCTVGQYLRVSLQVVARTEVRLLVSNGTFGATAYANNALPIGVNTFTIGPMTSSTFTIYPHCSTGSTATIDNVSVRELPGNHATQATEASRPTYGIVPAGGRRNLLTYSEEFGDSSWAKSGVTVPTTQYTAPDGTLTADALVLTGTGFNIQRAFSINVSGTYTASVSVKDNGAGSCMVAMGTGTIGYLINLNLTTGAFISGRSYGGGVLVGYTITSQGNGWWRVAVSVTASVGGVSVSSADGTSPTTGILLWGAQLEQSATATPYQKVTTQYDVTEAGVQSCSYLFFDGTDDSMSTPTITPGTDKAQVFAGVRKSGATAGILAELSSGVGDGRFYALNFTDQKWYFLSRGTGNSEASTPESYPAPIANVLTGLGDISGDTVTIRIDGTQVAQNTGNQGLGDYGNYPLYIGMRQGATPPSSNSLFFNGQIYGLITRFGPNLTGTTINATEYWVGDKTGVNIANNTSLTIFARDNTAVLDRANQIIERRA